MPIIVKPPRESTSLWQSVCLEHGLLIHAKAEREVLIGARLHEFWQGCTVVAGGLRCMFCQVVINLQWWAPGVQSCCSTCWWLIRHDKLPAHLVARELSYFAVDPIEPSEVIASASPPEPCPCP